MEPIRNNPAPAHLLDLTRTTRRAGLRATGIDRIERAYLAHLLELPVPFLGLVRTRLGYLLLDREAGHFLLEHCESRDWQRPAFSARSDKSTPYRAAAEAELRRRALDRCVPNRLGAMLARHLPAGSVYFNTSHLNFSDRVLHAINGIARTKTVVFVHDTIPLDFPQYQTQKSILKFRRFLRNVELWADLVICNSRATAREVERYVTELKAGGRVLPIHPGVTPLPAGDIPSGPWGNGRFFVCVGTIEPRKNLSLLLQIWKDMPQENRPGLLVCGRRGWLNDEVFAALDAGINDVFECPDLPDETLGALISASAGLLFPSLAEGFGFPAVEAALLGTPVLCNTLPALQEVLGDYPIYAAADDRYLWANNITKLVQRHRDKGGEQAHKASSFEAPTWRAHFNRLFTAL